MHGTRFSPCPFGMTSLMAETTVSAREHLVCGWWTFLLEPPV